MFQLPNKKLSEKLAPILKKNHEKWKYIKEEDPVYMDHMKKVRKILFKLWRRGSKFDPLWISRKMGLPHTREAVNSVQNPST